MPDVCALQLVPPLTVLTIVPLAPAAQQTLDDGQAIELSALAVPDVCALQFVPPFTVLMIVPLLPAAQQVVVLVQVMSCSALVVPLV